MRIHTGEDSFATVSELHNLAIQINPDGLSLVSDESLKHPLIEETISVGHCVLVWMAAVAATLVVVEGALFSVYTYPDRERSLFGKNFVTRIPYVAIELARIAGHFSFGALATLLTTEMAKFKVGRLRPYFLTLCDLRLTKGRAPTQLLVRPFSWLLAHVLFFPNSQSSARTTTVSNAS